MLPHSGACPDDLHHQEVVQSEASGLLELTATFTAQVQVRSEKQNPGYVPLLAFDYTTGASLTHMCVCLFAGASWLDFASVDTERPRHYRWGHPLSKCADTGYGGRWTADQPEPRRQCDFSFGLCTGRPKVREGSFAGA